MIAAKGYYCILISAWLPATHRTSLRLKAAGAWRFLSSAK
jgi:hypothetical protein